MAAAESLVPAANATQVAFQDDFESGSLSKWPCIRGEGFISTTRAHAGTRAFEAFNDPETTEAGVSSKTYLGHCTKEPSLSLYKAGGYYFSVWFFFPDDYPDVFTNFMQLKEAGGGIGGSGTFRPIALGRQPDGDLFVYSGIEGRTIALPGIKHPRGRWFNVVFLVRPGKPGTIRIWLDGTLIVDVRTDTLGNAESMYFGAGNYHTRGATAELDLLGETSTLWLDDVRVSYYVNPTTSPPPPSGGDDPPAEPAPGPAPPTEEPEASGDEPTVGGSRTPPTASYPVAWGTSAPRRRNLSTAVLTAIDDQRTVSADLILVDLKGDPMFVALAAQSLDFARPGVDLLPLRWLGVGGAMVVGTAEETGEMDGGGQEVQFAAEETILDLAPRLLYADLFNRWYEHWRVQYADEGPNAGRPTSGYLVYGGVCNGKPIVEDIVDEEGYRTKLVLVRFTVLPPLALVHAGTSMQTGLRSHQRWYPGDLGMDQVPITRNRRIWWGAKGPDPPAGVEP